MPSSERDIQIRRKRSRAEAERFPLSVTTAESKINRYAVPSRATILHMVDIRTQPSREQHKFVFEPKHRQVLIDYIDARIENANGNPDPLINFKARVIENEGNDKFEPETSRLATDMSMHFKIVLDTLPKPTSTIKR